MIPLKREGKAKNEKYALFKRKICSFQKKSRVQRERELQKMRNTLFSKEKYTLFKKELALKESANCKKEDIRSFQIKSAKQEPK